MAKMTAMPPPVDPHQCRFSSIFGFRCSAVRPPKHRPRRLRSARSHQWIRSSVPVSPSHDLWRETAPKRPDRPYGGRGQSGGLREKLAGIGSFRPGQSRRDYSPKGNGGEEGIRTPDTGYPRIMVLQAAARDTEEIASNRLKAICRRLSAKSVKYTEWQQKRSIIQLPRPRRDSYCKSSPHRAPTDPPPVR